MKANELMMGDWVYYDPNVFIEDEYETTKEVQTMQILNGEDIDIALDECYYPIPLTEDILEKNGFEYMNDEYGCWMMNKVELIEREPHNNLFEVEIRIANETVFLHYVHELQHALKLCKIEKEIKL